ncbi:MAG: primosomal protein N' [Pseudomonadota bacterium]
MTGAKRASVRFAMPLPEPFDYRVPEGVTVRSGDHVLAPLGPRSVPGVVWAVADDEGERTLKPLDGVIGGPPLPEATRRFVDWAAHYIVDNPGHVLRSVLRSPAALRPSPVEIVLEPTGLAPARLTPAREALLAAASRMGPASAAELAREAGVSSSVAKGLVEAGALKASQVLVDPPFDAPDPYRDGVTLSALQEGAAAQLRRMVMAGDFQAALLDGVTGSGKTEVYLEAVAELLRREPDAQVLLLLPEIALTQQVMARLEDRFGARPAQWHSAIADKERRRTWREVASGRARIVAGARSALFLPFKRLRCIIVDEEHDPTYKQDEGLIYHGRDLAVVRAKIEGALVVLASATPSLESLANAQAGRYVHIVLPARAGSAQLPAIDTIDLREHPPERGAWLSEPLVHATADALSRGEQTLLYLNRRGFAPLVLCRACGHKMKSPDTDRWLVEHRYTGRLVCHVTGFSMPKPKACPACGEKDTLTGVGPGVERVAEEARQRFPDSRVEVFSSDTAQSADDVRSVVRRMAEREIDILVGTQIAAKGHNFPHLTLVGVVDADLGLAGGDLRAGERTWQTLVQAAGRAGRADKPGRALLQTHQPEHETIQALLAGDREAFLSAERMMREALQLPPYGRLAAIILSAPDEARLEAAAREIAAAAPASDGVSVFGPAEPPLGVVRGRWRRRFLVQAERKVDISAYMRAWRGRFKTPSAVRVTIDIDPYSFL